MDAFTALLVTVLIAGVRAQCPHEYEYIGGKCLLFLEDISVTYEIARLVCQEDGGHLAVVDDCSLLGDIADHIYDRQLSNVSYWVGADDIYEEGSFKWVDGRSVALGAPLWAGNSNTKSEPNGEEEGSYCVAMDPDDGMYFHDYNCSHNYGVICQRDCACGICPPPYISVGESCFQFLDIGVDGFTARDVCRSSGGDLAVLDDCHSFADIAEHLRQKGPWSTYWIGGEKVGPTYRWIDGSPMKLGAPFWGRQQDWHGLQPDNYKNNEDCVHLWHRDQFYLNDAPCSNTYAPLCEAPLVQTTLLQQIAQ